MRCILHGGFKDMNTKQQAAAWQMFLQTFFLQASSDEILLLPWANSPKLWDRMASRFASRVAAVTGTRPHVEIATSGEDAQKMLSQFTGVYMPGGIDFKNIMTQVQSVPDLHAQLEGKTIAGVSAGAYALSSLFYDSRKKALAKGGGVLPVGVACHYSDKRAPAKELFEAEKLPYYLLDEGMFVTLNSHGQQI